MRSKHSPPYCRRQEWMELYFHFPYAPSWQGQEHLVFYILLPRRWRRSVHVTPCPLRYNGQNRGSSWQPSGRSFGRPIPYRSYCWLRCFVCPYQRGQLTHHVSVYRPHSSKDPFWATETRLYYVTTLPKTEYLSAFVWQWQKRSGSDGHSLACHGGGPGLTPGFLGF